MKKSREENNRQKQIDIQLQILDKIDQIDKESIDQNTLQTLRKHLYEEQQQGLLIHPSDDQLHHDSHTEVLPTKSQMFDSPYTVSMGERQDLNVLEQTMTPVTGELIVQSDSEERVNMSLITADTQQLYNELEKIRYSIEMAFENVQQSPDRIDRKIPLVSSVIIHSCEQ